MTPRPLSGQIGELGPGALAALVRVRELLASEA